MLNCDKKINRPNKAIKNALYNTSKKLYIKELSQSSGKCKDMLFQIKKRHHLCILSLRKLMREFDSVSFKVSNGDQVVIIDNLSCNIDINYMLYNSESENVNVFSDHFRKPMYIRHGSCSFYQLTFNDIQRMIIVCKNVCELASLH